MTLISKYYYTIKDLKWIQIKYQLLNKIKRSTYMPKVLPTSCKLLQFNTQAFSRITYKGESRFCFLNLEHSFNENINWDFNDKGKLWNYNLNYFDFLNQENITEHNGLSLISSWNRLTIVEPYPTSLRLINWIRFLSKHKIEDEEINLSINSQAQYLSENIEYHLLGNHILENGFALLISGYYLQRNELIKAASAILIQQLEEQILEDGGHFELSPMYHCIILNRVLEAIDLVMHNQAIFKSEELHRLLLEKASLMVSWLKAIKFRNGLLPKVNDSTFGIAPDISYLLDLAVELEIPSASKPLKDSGYRKLESDIAEVLLDVGAIGPAYIPGHAHSDTLSFVLHLNSSPIIVDTGISTYEKNQIRQEQRKTSAHNTVVVENKEQSVTWGGFRVAQKARISKLIEKGNIITASHNGYLRFACDHERVFELEDDRLVITDHLSKNFLGKAFYHFDHNVKIMEKASVIHWEDKYIDFENANTVEMETYEQALGFNKTKTAMLVVVTFRSYLQTRFHFK